MPTLLFPPNNAKVTIKQGETGDCYLLAALDCIFNANDEAYELIKSLFTEMRDGVEVRIKCTDQSDNLRPMNLHGKYAYHHDPIRQEDVFKISSSRLREIDRSAKGVVTNSLAVKILERISSYYFKRKWGESAPHQHHRLHRVTSLTAHNLKDRFDGTESLFVAKLLNIGAFSLHNIDTVIKLHTVFPEYPIYIGMDYGKRDAYGRMHSAHSLRIEKITPTRFFGRGDYRFVLVNPWDNQRREILNLPDLRQRGCDFCFFKTNAYRYELILTLSRLPDLLNMICEIKEINGSLSPKDVEYCIMILRYRHSLPAIFRSFSLHDKQTFIAYMLTAKSDLEHRPPQEIVRLFDEKIDEIQLVHQHQTIDNANAYIASFVQQINRLAVRFSASHTLVAVDAMSKHLIARLDGLSQYDLELTIAERNLGLTRGIHHQSIIEAIARKMQEIHHTAHQQRFNLRHAQTTIDTCIAELNTFQASFDTSATFQEIERRHITLLSQIDDIVAAFPDILFAASTLGYTSLRSGDIFQAMTIKRNYIHQLANKATQRVHENIYISSLIPSKFRIKNNG